MSGTDTTSELRQIPEIIEKVYALAKQGKDCTEPAIRDMYALLAAQKQRWEAAARISELERLTVKHNKKSVGDTDCSVVNVLLAERIAELQAAPGGVIGEPLDGLETPSEPAK